MAALDRLDDLEEFLLGHPARRCVPATPDLAAARVACTTTRSPRRSPIASAPPAELGAALAASSIELLVYATDVSDYPEGDQERDFELEYSSRTSEPEMMGRAILASAAISGLVLPISVDGRIATDGGWVRNFPFEHAYRNPEVGAIAAFRYVPSYPVSDAAYLERTRERLERFRAVPPVRALLVGGAPRPGARIARRAGALRRADRAAHARGVRDATRSSRIDSPVSARRPCTELQRLREDVIEPRSPPRHRWRRRRLRADLESRFAAARFPFRHDRHVPALIVRGTAARRQPRPDVPQRAPLAGRAQASAHRARLHPHRRSARRRTPKLDGRIRSRCGREADAFRDAAR